MRNRKLGSFHASSLILSNKRLQEKKYFQIFNISSDFTTCVYTVSDHLTQSMRSKVHIAMSVITKVHMF